MSNILKYAAIALFLSNASVCKASQEEIDLESQRAPVVVYQQNTVSKTAEHFLKHGVGDVAFLAVTGAQQLSNAEPLEILFYAVQAARYYQIGMACYHATSDAIKYNNWPYVWFAAAMFIHAVGDLAFDLPSLATAIRNSVGLKSIIESIAVIDDLIGANAIINYAAGAAAAIKHLAVPIAAITFTLALYRFQHDGSFDAAWEKVKELLLEKPMGEAEEAPRARSKKGQLSALSQMSVAKRRGQ